MNLNIGLFLILKGLVIRLFAESQKALIAQPGLFLVPTGTFLILAMFLSYWILTSFMIYSFDTYDASFIIFFGYKIDRKILTKALWVYV